MSKRFFILFFLCLMIEVMPQSNADIILTEVMFNPQSGNNEFIEIFNQNQTSSINLSGFRIKYYTSNPDSITDAGFGLILPPNSYAVILEKDYDLETGIYNNLIPVDALVLRIHDNAFGSNGMANTTSRQILILSPQDDTIQTYTYSANNSTAFSDEKIEISQNNNPENWTNSLMPNGTPGLHNSVTKYQHDLAVTSISAFPDILTNTDSILISSVIRNIGLALSGNFTITISNDKNLNGIPDPDELLFTAYNSNLLPDDSIKVTFITDSLKAGNNEIITVIDYSLDMNLLNNSLRKTITVNSPYISYNDIIVNEVMYAPASPMPEWIEIYNRSSKQINIKNFLIGDANSRVKIADFDKYISPKSFMVLSKDSTIFNFYEIESYIVIPSMPAFNNTEDAVILLDSLKLLVDSTYYYSFYGGIQGYSLERVEPDLPSLNQDNWKTSVNLKKGTPGFINSVTKKDKDAAIIDFKPLTEFSMIGENNLLKIKIKNIGKSSISNLTLKLYSDANNDSIPQISELIFSYNNISLSLNDSIQVSKEITVSVSGENRYIALLESSQDEDTSNNSKLASIKGVSINEIRNDLVINEIMYAPKNDEPEWIELFNPSQKIISLKNYSIADNKDTIKILLGNKNIYPGKYIIIAKDSSIRHNGIDDSLIIIASFPTLNNDADKIMIIDSVRRVIDSLKYINKWGGSNGKSLERIDPFMSSTDSLNWKETRNSFGSTPGYINSRSKKEYDIFAEKFNLTSEYPKIGDTVSFFAQLSNVGKKPLQFMLELYEDKNLDTIPEGKIANTQFYTIVPDDSMLITFTELKVVLSSEVGYLLKAICSEDEDIDNNIIYQIISPGYPQYSIVINEIMYDSQTDEPEWIELYNRSNYVIDLYNWSLKDVFTAPSVSRINERIKLLPNSYLVISKDSSINNFHSSIPSELLVMNFPILNNDKDGIIVLDNKMQIVDSVKYFATWNSIKGASLERKYFDSSSVSELNWQSSTSPELSTPGKENGATPYDHDLKLTEIIIIPESPLLFDSLEVNIKIQNIGKLQSDSSSVKLFCLSPNIEDSLIYSYSIGTIAPASFITHTVNRKIIFNKDEMFLKAVVEYPPDECYPNNSLTRVLRNTSSDISVMINEIMIDPIDEKSEWVELINVSTSKINLRNWALSDWISTPTVSPVSLDDFWIEPNDYVIVANDSLVLKTNPHLKGKIRIADFGTLNNSQDGVFLYNQFNLIVDSVCYNSKWRLKKGNSLERISINNTKNDSLNWFPSQDTKHHTMGAENSVISLQSYKQNSLVVNEIMYESFNVCEYLEFQNTSYDTINLAGFEVFINGNNRYSLTDSLHTLCPNDYFLLASDSSILLNYNELNYVKNKKFVNASGLGLLNSGCSIVLLDFTGATIDSINYLPNWHNKNVLQTSDKSLERINPLLNSNDKHNWSTSVNSNGGTPGKQNSIYAVNNERNSGMTINPNPFSPDNDGFEDFTIINYNLNSNLSQITIKIFDSKGRIARTLLNNAPTGPSGSIIFDGNDETGNPLRIGIYPILLISEDENHINIEKLKGVVVIARKL